MDETENDLKLEVALKNFDKLFFDEFKKIKLKYSNLKEFCSSIDFNEYGNKLNNFRKKYSKFFNEITERWMILVSEYFYGERNFSFEKVEYTKEERRKISDDDILNLRIELSLCNDVEEFLNKI